MPSDPTLLSELKSQVVLALLALSKESEGNPLNSDYDVALKRASKCVDFIVKEASAPEDDRIYAYQLFSADSPPMTFGDITKRFIEMGWQISYNTTVTYVEQILTEANLDIETKLEGLDVIRDQAIGFSTDVDGLHERLSRHLIILFKRTVLRRFVLDYETVSRDLAANLIQKIGESSPLLQTWTNEHENAYLGYWKFLRYVCGDQSYESFIKFNHLNQRLFLGRVDSVAYYLKELGHGGLSAREQTSVIAENLNKLRCLFLGEKDVLKRIHSMIADCAKFLQKENPDIDGAKAKALEALPVLERYRDWWRVSSLLRLNPIANIKNSLEAPLVCKNPLPDDSRNETNQPNTYSRDDLAKKIINHLETMTIAVERSPLDHTDGELFKSVADCAKAIQLFAEQHSQSEESPNGGQLIATLNRLKTAIDEVLQNSKVCNSTSRENLHKLLDDLTKYSGSRKIRPYPLFLYAAQNGILKNELIKKRNEWTPDTDLTTAHKSTESILCCHAGMLESTHNAQDDVSATSARTPF